MANAPSLSLDTVLKVSMRTAGYGGGAHQWRYSRFAIVFGKEPVEVGLWQLADNLADAIERVIVLIEELNLLVVLAGPDGEEVELSEGMVSAYQSAMAEARAAAQVQD